MHFRWPPATIRVLATGGAPTAVANGCFATYPARSHDLLSRPHQFPGSAVDEVPFDSRHRPLCAWAILLAACLAPPLAAQTEGAAQTGGATPTEGAAPPDEAAEQQRAEAVRQQMYETLSREVAALERQSNALKMVVKLMRPTVVHIEAEKIEPSSVRYGRPDQIEEAGSGCVIKINDHYYVLTNGHVIRAAKPEKITIRLADGRELHPQRVWSDPKTDVAIMAIDAPHLVAARIGDSAQLEIGDFVLAIGSPFGLSHSITFGIVSATNRRDFELGEGVEFQDFIQTDAAINPGNSGGPLINLRGEVIGMNTAIASNSGGNEGIGFSIPINLVMQIAKQLVERSSVTRAHLGVVLDWRVQPGHGHQRGTDAAPRRTDQGHHAQLARRGCQTARRRRDSRLRRRAGRQRQPPDQPGESDRSGSQRALGRLSQRPDHRAAGQDWQQAVDRRGRHSQIVAPR